MSKPRRLPAHLEPLTIDIPRTWTPEQALALFELLDESARQGLDALWRPNTGAAPGATRMRRRLAKTATPATKNPELPNIP